MAAEPVAEVEPDGHAVGAGEGRDQRQQAVCDHRGAGGPLPRSSGEPDESGGTAYLRCRLQEILAQTGVVRFILRDCLVIDTFDNSTSRRLVQEHCRALELPCLHVGLYSDYGEVIWDERYRVPRDVAGDVCDYPLARNLVLLVVAVSSEALVRFALLGGREDFSVTLRDFAIRPLERR